MSSVSKNYLYSVLYQMLTIAIPLITTPYLSRTLGAEGVGVYSYTNSIVQYFVLISMLGINEYGIREIGSKQNKEDRSKSFKEIYSIQAITSAIALVAYFVYLFVVNPQYKTIALIQSIVLVTSMLDINWFFFGIERFKLTVTRNTIIKLFSLVAIFVFVKDSSDLWKYVIIVIGGNLLSNIILWIFLKEEIISTKISITNIARHFIPCLILLLPMLSRSIFVYLDKTMLGMLSGMVETGYYEYSEKIILAVTSILTALGTVMLPRISFLIAQGKERDAHKLTGLSIDFVVGLGMPLVMGILAVSDSLVSVFLGDDYVGCENIVNCMAITVILVGWTNVIRTQYILPYKKDKIYMIAVALGAIVDLGVNLLLIPAYGAFGAAIGWVAAELVITFTQTICASKKLPIIQYLWQCRGFAINSVIMCLVVHNVSRSFDSPLKSLIVGVLSGIFVYGVSTGIYIKLIRKDLWLQLMEYVGVK